MLSCHCYLCNCAAVSIDFYNFVDPVYSIQNTVNAYSGQRWPIGNEDCITATSGWTLVPNPSTLCAKGRPKSTSIWNEMDMRESRRTQQCRVCKKECHNRCLCPHLSGSQSSQHDTDTVDDEIFKLCQICPKPIGVISF